MTPFDVCGKDAFSKKYFLCFSHNVFFCIKDRNYHLSCIHFVVCKCFQFGQGQIFVAWEWVKVQIASQIFTFSVPNISLRPCALEGSKCNPQNLETIYIL